MREFRMSGSVRGAVSNGRPYRDLIRRAGTNDNSRAPLPLGTSSEGREVGAQTRHPLFNTICLRNRFDEAFWAFGLSKNGLHDFRSPEAKLLATLGEGGDVVGTP